MTLPISYNIRNLRVRKTTTLLTAMGIGLTVAVLVAVLALAEGLRSSFAATGHPLNLLVMRRGSTAELTSIVSRTDFQALRYKAGVERASLEVVTLLNAVNPAQSGSLNVTLRGIERGGIDIREKLRIVEGRWFQAGRRELVAGKGIAARYPGLRPGSRVKFGRGYWDVVGIMDGGRSAVNSEVFTDLNQLAADQDRVNFLSAVLIRATDRVSLQALRNDLESDPRLNVTAEPERSYYASQTTAGRPVQFMGLFICSIMAVGSSFAAMNTMYAAVARRSAEIGMLRVLGFTRAGILLSFVLESLLLSLLGGFIGCLLALPLNDWHTQVGSLRTFTEFSFGLRITPGNLGTGIAFALLMGTIGGLFPARSAAKKEILTALAE